MREAAVRERLGTVDSRQQSGDEDAYIHVASGASGRVGGYPNPSGGSEGVESLVEWLDGHTNFEAGMPARAQVPTLERIGALCHLLGDPHLAYPVVHVTGTNGKGSTVRMISALLMARGLHVGTYTSPNLRSVNERLTSNLAPVDDDALAGVLAMLQQLEPMVEGRITRFELLTAAAFVWFADIAVDVAVVEVGLGGRWDATNVVEPSVTVVTNVSYDHVDVLGPTLGDIAREKSGIVKPGAPLVLGETDPDLAAIFTAAANRVGASVWPRGAAWGCRRNQTAVGGRLLDLWGPHGAYDDVFLALHGSHQGDNAAAALAAAEAFFDGPLPREVVDEAFGSVSVPGRLEVVGRSPTIVLDGAHNVAGVAALARALTEDLPITGMTVAVVGMLRERDPSALLAPLAAAGVHTVVICPAPSERTLPVSTVMAAAVGVGMRAYQAETVRDAVLMARTLVDEPDRIVIAGSLYVVAAARELLLDAPRGPGQVDEPAVPL